MLIKRADKTNIPEFEHEWINSHKYILIAFRAENPMTKELKIQWDSSC